MGPRGHQLPILSAWGINPRPPSHRGSIYFSLGEDSHDNYVGEVDRNVHHCLKSSAFGVLKQVQTGENHHFTPVMPLDPIESIKLLPNWIFVISRYGRQHKVLDSLHSSRYGESTPDVLITLIFPHAPGQPPLVPFATLLTQSPKSLNHTYPPHLKTMSSSLKPKADLERDESTSSSTHIDRCEDPTQEKVCIESHTEIKSNISDLAATSKARAHRSRLLRRARLFLSRAQEMDYNPSHIPGSNVYEF